MPLFTAPNVVKGEESVGFNGMESERHTRLGGHFVGGAQRPNYAMYTWNFGDGNRGDATPEVSGFAPGSPACEEPWLSTWCAQASFTTTNTQAPTKSTLT